jgi:energy-coupling factor transporter transmembrane protein EcfT
MGLALPEVYSNLDGEGWVFCFFLYLHYIFISPFIFLRYFVVVFRLPLLPLYSYLVVFLFVSSLFLFLFFVQATANDLLYSQIREGMGPRRMWRPSTTQAGEIRGGEDTRRARRRRVGRGRREGGGDFGESSTLLRLPLSFDDDASMSVGVSATVLRGRARYGGVLVA